jgi:hypothetical protein
MNLKIPRVIKNWQYAKFVTPAANGFVINKAGPGRRSAVCNDPLYRVEAFKEFGLTPDLEEPVSKNFTGNHYLNGAYVHEHTDAAPSGYVHVRCNLMINKPKFGGMPVINGQELCVDEGDLWLCLASLEKHSSTPISGGERVIFSFGALINKQKIDQILL